MWKRPIGNASLGLLLIALSAGCSSSEKKPVKQTPPETAPPTATPPQGAAAAPCVYSGTLRTRGKIFSAPMGGKVIHTLTGQPFRKSSAVQVRRLEPARHKGGRAKIELLAPIKLTGWLDTTATPLALTKRLDLVKNHVWLQAGFEVKAFAPNNGTILVSRKLPTTRLAKPMTLTRRMACGALTLSPDSGFVGPTAGADDAFADLGPGPVTLYDRPRGKPVVKLRSGGRMMVKQRKGGWLRVAEAEPIHVDGWVPAKQAPPAKPDKPALGQTRRPNP